MLYSTYVTEQSHKFGRTNLLYISSGKLMTVYINTCVPPFLLVMFDCSTPYINSTAYICVYIHIHTYIHTHIHTYIRTYIRTYIHIRMYSLVPYNLGNFHVKINSF